MSHWTHKLDIRDAWKKAEDDDDFKALSKVIVEKLEKIDFGPDLNYERDGIVEAFKDLIDDVAATVGEFDSLLSELYDFGDTPLDNNWPQKRVLWIETF